jgi:hypothetical protein
MKLQLKKLNREVAKAAKPFSNRNGRFEKTAIILLCVKRNHSPEIPEELIALSNRPFRFGKKTKP